MEKIVVEEYSILLHIIIISSKNLDKLERLCYTEFTHYGVIFCCAPTTARDYKHYAS